MRDFHHVIVHHVGQVVGGIAVGFQQYLVVNLPVVDGDRVAKGVMHHRAAFLRNLEAHH